MSRLTVMPIVEGHGEVEAVRILLDRVWREIAGGDYIDVLKPIRWPRSKLIRSNIERTNIWVSQENISRVAQLGALKLRDAQPRPEEQLILVLMDADDDCPKELAPQVVRIIRDSCGAIHTACVLAKVEYESWFVGAAESLWEFIEITNEASPPIDPETGRQGKTWLERHWRGRKYSETVDQPRLTARFDLYLCRDRCPSFDKLCRTLVDLAPPRGA